MIVKNKFIDILLKPGTYVKTHVKTVFNEENAPNKKHLLIIHGLVHRSTAYEDWSKRILTTSPYNEIVSAISLLDLPGRGESGIPEPRKLMSFGSLNLNNYVKIIQDVIQSIKTTEKPVDCLVGHSMGGILIQMLAEKCLRENTTLRQKLGVDTVILVAPTMPREVPWRLADSKKAVLLAMPHLRIGKKGAFAKTNAVGWLDLFSKNSRGEIAPTAPKVIDADKYIAQEPFAALNQLVGAFVRRPSISRNSFESSHGTRLFIAGMENDILITTQEQSFLYRYLTGDPDYKNYVNIAGEHAVHDVVLSDPAQLDPVLQRLVDGLSSND